MQVWNTFHPQVINHIIGEEKMYQNQGIGGGEVTVDELVRKTAISEEKRRKMERSAQSFINFKNI